MIAPPPTRRTIHSASGGPRPAAGSVMVSQVVAADGRRIPSESLDRLERLDDTVFAALAGDAKALQETAKAWREAQQTVETRLLDEARNHYVDRARSRWKRSQHRTEGDLAAGFAALEVIDLLAG